MRVTYFCCDADGKLEYVAGHRCYLERWEVRKNPTLNPVSYGGKVAWFNIGSALPCCVTSHIPKKGEEEWTFVLVHKCTRSAGPTPTLVRHMHRFNIVWNGAQVLVCFKDLFYERGRLYAATPAMSLSEVDRSNEPNDEPSFYVIPRGPNEGVDLYCSDFDFGRTREVDGVLKYLRGPKLPDLVRVDTFVEHVVATAVPPTRVKVIPTDEMFIKWWADAKEWYRLDEPHPALRARSSRVKAAFLGKRKGGRLDKWTIPLPSEDAELVVSYKKIRSAEGGSEAS